jgi:hypothetical protein
LESLASPLSTAAAALRPNRIPPNQRTRKVEAASCRLPPNAAGSRVYFTQMPTHICRQATVGRGSVQKNQVAFIERALLGLTDPNSSQTAAEKPPLDLIPHGGVRLSHAAAIRSKSPDARTQTLHGQNVPSPHLLRDRASPETRRRVRRKLFRRSAS